jgi:RimJ/RimL family protein N-acetyltransferase
MLRNYPKTVTLKNGGTVAIRPLKEEDEHALRDFYLSLTPEDRRYLKHDVTNPKIVHQWTHYIDYDHVIPLVAEESGTIVAAATLHRNPHSWSPHVGEIRLVTHKDFRRSGLGMLMAKEIFSIATYVRLEKVIAEMVEDQTAAIRIFEKMGFEREALLRNQVIDHEGQQRDLVVMSAYLSWLWEKIADVVMDSYSNHSGRY